MSKEQSQSSSQSDFGEPSGIQKIQGDRKRIRDNSAEHISEKQKLIEQNIGLKTQILDLERQLDEIMEREQKKKVDYGSEAGDDESIKNRRIEVRKQQLEVHSLKNKINLVKRQLETVFNNRALMAKEDELKYLQSELEALEAEKTSLLKIKNEHTKALKVLRNEEEYEDRIDELRKELAGLKEESRALNERVTEAERVLRKNHEQFVVKQSKVRELEQKTLANQNQISKSRHVQAVTPQMVARLEEEVGQLEQKREEVEKSWHDKINAIDIELREKKSEQSKKLMLLKEKEKEMKLNELKIKELRKLIRHNLTQPNNTESQEIDLSQFRYKRNIKYVSG